MDAREVELIINTTARTTVDETLRGLGMRTEEPHEMQADMLYLRKLRKGSDMLSFRLLATIITVLAPACLYMAWEGIKQALQK